MALRIAERGLGPIPIDSGIGLVEIAEPTARITVVS
jgi:hypothetical protein